MLLPVSYSEAPWNILSHSLSNQEAPCCVPRHIAVSQGNRAPVGDLYLPSSPTECLSLRFRAILFTDTLISLISSIQEISIVTEVFWKYLYPKYNRTAIMMRCQGIEEMFGDNRLSGCLPEHPRKLVASFLSPQCRPYLKDWLFLYTDSLKGSCHFRLHKPKLFQNQVLGGKKIEVLLII